MSVEKCGGDVGKCVGVWGEVGCVEKCGESVLGRVGGGGVCGKMWESVLDSRLFSMKIADFLFAFHQSLNALKLVSVIG